jgi:alpha-mannosidase
VAECNRVAREAAQPVVCHPVNQPNGSRPPAESWLKISNPAITLLAFKPSMADRGVAIRLFNNLDKSCAATLLFPSWIPREAWLCDQVERRIEKYPLKNGKLAVKFPARTALLFHLSFGFQV